MLRLLDRVPRLRHVLGLALALAAGSYAFPWLARWTIARRISHAAAARGLTPPWAAREVRVP